MLTPPQIHKWVVTIGRLQQLLLLYPEPLNRLQTGYGASTGMGIPQATIPFPRGYLNPNYGRMTNSCVAFSITFRHVNAVYLLKCATNGGISFTSPSTGRVLPLSWTVNNGPQMTMGLKSFMLAYSWGVSTPYVYLVLLIMILTILWPISHLDGKWCDR